MNYPLWDVPLLGGGIVIAMIAIVHVFVSHFAVGGGLFLLLGERKAYRDENRELLSYVRKHSRFFVLVTLVLGAVTGVGIWFSIGLAHPAATSLLIRNFVWAWAIEWCFFFVEIAAILVYYYGWDRLTRRSHLRVGWIYVVAAAMSLVVINGILSFMLTPGRWLQTGGFWAGLLNPSYLPSLFLRAAVALALAGLYGLLTSSMMEGEKVRAYLVRWSTRWVFAGFAVMPLAGLWYLFAIPPDARQIAFGGAPPVTIFLALSLGLSVFLLLFTWLTAWRQPQRFSPALASLFLVVGFMVTATSEWVREAVRKPYVIHGTMYSNGIRPSEIEAISREGFLPQARWAGVREVTSGNRLRAGEEIFRLQCGNCHTVDGYNAIRPLIKGWRESFLSLQIKNLNELKGFMPPFAGTDEERRALAHYLASLWGFPTETQPVPAHVPPDEEEQEDQGGER